MARYANVALIEARIKALQMEARKLERSATKGLRAAAGVIKKYGLSLSDLRQALAMSAGRGRSKLAGRRVPVKYRDDKGNTWSGRGRPPLWLVAAEKAGKKRDSFSIAATPSSSSAKAKSKAKRARPNAKQAGRKTANGAGQD